MPNSVLAGNIPRARLSLVHGLSALSPRFVSLQPTVCQPCPRSLADSPHGLADSSPAPSRQYPAFQKKNN